jgi:hypothetical protein
MATGGAMSAAAGLWDIIGSYTSLLGYAYSLCYDQELTLPANVVAVRRSGTSRRRYSLAGISIRSLQRGDADRVTFSGVVRAWNGVRCEPRAAQGYVMVHTGLGQCEIGDVVESK